MKYRGICYFPLHCNFFQPLLGQVLLVPLLVPLVYFLLDPSAPCAPPWAGARCSLGSLAGARKDGMQLWPPRDLWVGSSPRAGLPNQSLLTVASS